MDDNKRQATASDEDALKRAKEKMKEAISTKGAGGEVEVKSASTKASVEDAQISGSTKAQATKKAVDDGKHLSRVRVYSPYKVYFDGPATSITAENETGVFDILPGHKNFMTLLKASDIIIRTDRGEERVKTNSAVMHVSQNVVRIFLDV